MENYRGKKVLITGGLGFIGSNLALELCSHGAKVTIVDAMLPEYGANLSNVSLIRDQVDIQFADVRDANRLDEWVEHQDVIFCLAGQVSHVASMRQPLVDLDINCRSLVCLLESCRLRNPTTRIVLAGTRQVYGRAVNLPVTEEHPINPVDVNGINKWAAERYSALYSQVYGISTICLRLTNTYGPRMDIVNANKGFLGVFIGKALLGQTIRIFGDGKQRRDFNYVSDVVEALMLAGMKREISGLSLNLGNELHHSLNDFVDVLSRCLPVNREYVPFPDERQAIDIGDCYSDFSAFRRLTGWCPRIGLQEGLNRTISFFQNHLEMQPC